MTEPVIYEADSYQSYLAHIAKIWATFLELEAQPIAGNDIAAICEDSDKIIEEAREMALNGLKIMGELPPMVTFLSRSGGLAKIIMEGMPGSRGRQFMTALPLSVMLKSAPIDAYSIFAEIWVASPKEDETPEQARRMPSERPDRQEGVFIVAGTRMGSAVKLFMIKRNRAHKVTALVPSDRTALQTAADLPTTHEAFNPLLTNLFTLADRVHETGDHTETVTTPDPTIPPARRN